MHTLNPETHKHYKYIYGPVPSRRFGFSLGIDLVPFKNCSFDCIYCQLGRTTHKTIERKEYTPTQDILQEVKHALIHIHHVDYLTFSGSGEPTLHSRIGYCITELKKTTAIPIVVLTNGSLLFMEDVRKDLTHADVVAPTLCTAHETTFRKIHRCHHDLKLNAIIDGMIQFREIFKGELWLELVFVLGFNDTESEIRALKETVEKINPDKIHLNTVVRPPSEPCARPLTLTELEILKNTFGSRAEIIASFKPQEKIVRDDDKGRAILNMIQRRPVTLDDICTTTGLHKNEIVKYLDILKAERKIRAVRHSGLLYYEITTRE